jgi:AmmeMemoRadiSam system protein A
MSPLPEEPRRALVALAREAVTEAVVHHRLLESSACEEELPRPAGVFVTLRREGRLRGCVGRVGAADPLPVALAVCGYAAALEDGRFPPVRPEELPLLEIEVSLLSRLTPARPEEVEVGRHGLRIRRGSHQGLLLPQVPVELGWDRERFLAETCAKAGLARDAWRDPETSVEVFTTEIVSEAEFAGAARRGRSG